MAKNAPCWDYGNDWLHLGNVVYDFTDKTRLINDIVRYMLIRTQAMFEYTGLPETIPQKFLEAYVQSSGFAGIVKVRGELYAMWGGLGGVPDVYYQPTVLTVANPALHYDGSLEIGKDCEIIRNDFLFEGLKPLCSRYATLLAENFISIRMASINKRTQTFLRADNDRDKDAADKFVKDLVDGKLSAVMTTPFFDGITAQPYGQNSGSSQITELTELHQYLESKWFNELGLQANYNMKRESLSAAELGLNNDIMLPMIDQMLLCRQQDLEKVNAMYGTNISVKLSSAWEDVQLESEYAINEMKAEAEGVQTSGQEIEPDDELKEGDDDGDNQSEQDD